MSAPDAAKRDEKPYDELMSVIMQAEALFVPVSFYFVYNGI